MDPTTAALLTKSGPDNKKISNPEHMNRCMYIHMFIMYANVHLADITRN